MNELSITDICEWLKTSIHGIIILGALGSIFGTFVLRTVKSILFNFIPYIKNKIKQTSKNWVLRIIESALKSYLRSKYLIDELNNEGKEEWISTAIITHAISFGISFALTTILSIGTIVFITITGIEYPMTSVFLIAISLIFFYFLISDIISGVVIYRNTVYGKILLGSIDKYRSGINLDEEIEKLKSNENSE